MGLDKKGLMIFVRHVK